VLCDLITKVCHHCLLYWGCSFVSSWISDNESHVVLILCLINGQEVKLDDSSN